MRTLQVDSAVAPRPSETRTVIVDEAGGVMPVTRLNNTPVKDGRMGAVTRTLVDAYWAKHVSPEWSVAVDDVLSRPGPV